MGESTCVVQVTNVAPAATLEQMESLFQFLGQIDQIAMYPNDTDETTNNTQSKVCFVKYKESSSVLVAQHLTNTVFIDRALIVQPHSGNQIPDASNASMLTSGTPFNGGSNSGLMSQIVAGVGGAQVISTIDPRLAALGLPQYPPLPANTDPGKVEEIRRTIYVGNLDSKITAEETLKFFNQIGEVKYVRMAGDETQPTRFAFVEFTEQSSVANALQYNGVSFGGRPLKINHSNNAIVKPQAKSAETAQKEIEEAMKRVREAQNQIKAQIDTQSNSRSGSNDKSPTRKDAFNDSTDRKSGRDRTRSRSKSREKTRTSPSRSTKSRSSRHKERERERPRSRSRTRYERERSRERTSRDRESRRHPRSPRRRSRSTERTRPERRSRERSPISISSSRRIARSKSRERRSRSREKDHRTSRSSRNDRGYSSKDLSRNESSRRDYRR